MGGSHLGKLTKPPNKTRTVQGCFWPFLSGSGRGLAC
jgi:hypothetical protein